MARKRHYLQQTGKIARLPHEVREQLHAHMHNGWPGFKILAWLHAQPDVMAVLREQFGGNLITHQNLSVWRHRAHREWLRARERAAMLKAIRG